MSLYWMQFIFNFIITNGVYRKEDRLSSADGLRIAHLNSENENKKEDWL